MLDMLVQDPKPQSSNIYLRVRINTEMCIFHRAIHHFIVYVDWWWNVSKWFQDPNIAIAIEGGSDNILPTNRQQTIGFSQWPVSCRLVATTQWARKPTFWHHLRHYCAISEPLSDWILRKYDGRTNGLKFGFCCVSPRPAGVNKLSKMSIVGRDVHERKLTVVVDEFLFFKTSCILQQDSRRKILPSFYFLYSRISTQTQSSLVLLSKFDTNIVKYSP